MDALKRKISRVKKLHEELCKELIVLGAQREEAMAREVLVAMKKKRQELQWAHDFLTKALIVECNFSGKLRLYVNKAPNEEP